MEMKTDYRNFDHQDEEEEQFDDAKETQETSFTDELDKMEDETLFDAEKDLVKNPENFTQSDKRIFLKKYFKYRVFGDKDSRDLLDRTEMKKGSDTEVDVYFLGEKIGAVDLESGRGTFTKSAPGFAAFDSAYRKIVNYRLTTLKGQIEENTGDDSEVFNGVVEDNIKKKFQKMINFHENQDESITRDSELQQLREDYKHIIEGEKIATDAGMKILVDEIGVARRSIEFQKLILKRLPIVSAIMLPIIAVLTLVILAARGAFYSASNAVAPSKKKSGKKTPNDTFDPIREAQKLASDVLDQFGENIEITTAVAIAAYLVFRNNRM